jgi:hypothetical protein
MSPLWAELECCHSGEDGRIINERNRERHRNLEGDYGPPVATPVAHATHSPSSLGAMGGCMALAPHLRMWSDHASFSPTYRGSTTGLVLKKLVGPKKFVA